MNKKDEAIFKDLIARYKDQYDRNQYARTNYDEDLEVYTGYRDYNNYPLAYNQVFNRVLPIIYTILSRFMDQLYQTGNIVSVYPRKSKDLNRAKKAEGVLNFQLETLNDIDAQGGSYLTMMRWFFHALAWGKGIIKCYWRKEERISPKRVALPYPKFDRRGQFQGYETIDYLDEEMQTIYDGPYVENLHPKLCVPHPEYKNIQQMPAFFIVYQRSYDYVKEMANKGVYKNIKELGWESSGGAGPHPRDSMEGYLKGLHIDGGLEMEQLNVEGLSPNVDIIECYGKAIVEDAPYEIGSGIKIKGREAEIIAHIGNYHTLLSIQENKYGIRPIFDVGCYMHPELFWDIGMIRLTKGLQEQINTLANTRMQNIMMMINPMLMVRSNADIDPESLIWKPFGIIPTEEPTDVSPLIIPDYHSNAFMEQEKFYSDTIQDLTGMYNYNMGQTPQRQEHVGVVHSIQSMGEARAKLMLMSMDYIGIRPLLKYMMILNTFHLPTGFEYRVGDGDTQDFGQVFGADIHSDFDFKARYTSMEPALGKQFRAQQLIQMAQMWAQSPWINQYQMLKMTMELLDIKEAGTLLKEPQQFMQEMQQQQKSAMMAEATKAQYETDGKLKLGDQELRNELTINKQEFGYDMALAALKLEAAEKKSQVRAT